MPDIANTTIAARAAFARFSNSGRSTRIVSTAFTSDAIGVTKAAVYHQYPAKDEIVLAVAEVVVSGSPIDLDALWAEFGISLVRGEIVYDDDAPMADLRKKLLES